MLTTFQAAVTESSVRNTIMKLRIEIWEITLQHLRMCNDNVKKKRKWAESKLLQQ
jgi:hypothetical protein